MSWEREKGEREPAIVRMSSFGMVVRDIKKVFYRRSCFDEGGGSDSGG